jgi:hypothetical protein
MNTTTRTHRQSALLSINHQIKAVAIAIECCIFTGAREQHRQCDGWCFDVSCGCCRQRIRVPASGPPGRTWGERKVGAYSAIYHNASAVQPRCQLAQRTNASSCCDSLSDMISSVALIVRENINLRRGFWYARFAPCQREDESPHGVGLVGLVLTGSDVGFR